MRKLHELGYGQKSMIVIDGNTKKSIDFKMSVGGVCSVVVSKFEKGKVFGWNKVSSYSTVINKSLLN